MSFRVLGTGMYVPPRVVTNDDLSQFLETNDEWITQRVGVKERHISTNETAADMGAKAARLLWKQWRSGGGNRPDFGGKRQRGEHFPFCFLHDSESAGAFLHDHGYQCGMLCV